MKILLTVCIIIGITNEIFSQPLNGSYTIGGNSPDFTTLQDASDALNVNGISSPVIFNIRPGVYVENGGNSTVLILDGVVAGLSETNRVTFQPDDAAGGNVDNVILQMHITDPNTADQDLVQVKLDFISFRNLTFQESDTSLHRYGSTFVRVRNSSSNLNVNGLLVEGCNFNGSAPYATEFGIQFSAQPPEDVTIRGNTFFRLLYGIYKVGGITQGTLTIEDNKFLAGWRTTSGSGNSLGGSIQVTGQHLIIRKNLIDFEGSFNSGYQGIYIDIPTGTESIVIEQNTLRGSVQNGIYLWGFIGGFCDSVVIANNMININGSIGLSVAQSNGNVKILFNTIKLSGAGLESLRLHSPNCIVLNNIILGKVTGGGGYNVCYHQGNAQSPNLLSDYNVLYMPGSTALVVRDGVAYPTLSAYRNATGLDTNSISKAIEFIDSTNLHISDCQSQDPDLKGIPVSEISVDIDEEIRSTTTPMIGADENGFTGFQMFSDPYRTALTGTAFSIAADNFDNILYDGIAVTDYSNRQVLLYHNLPPRSFELAGILQTPFNPVVVKFYDLDEDNNLDLIVGGDTSAVSVFWGDGAGGFSTPVTIGTFGRVQSLEPGPTINGDIKRTIAITQDFGFVSTVSMIGYLMHLGNRNLCHDVQWFQTNINPPIFSFPDTVDAAMRDFVFGEFSEDGDFPEIAAVTSSPFPHPLIVISDIDFPGYPGNCTGFIPLGTINEYQLGSGVGATSIVMGDFDGDSDLDLITTETLSSVKFIRNEGSLNFISESISVTNARGIATMDYENDGDLDFITVNERLEENGITVFLNDGIGNFTTRENCFFPFATGLPRSVVASDFDQDGKTDIAIVSSVSAGVDSLFVLYNLGGGTVGIQNEETEEIPTSFSLAQNYPNPFNPTTTIQFSLPQAGDVTLKIYNLLGEEVKTLVEEYRQAGIHSVQFHANTLASGIYFYRIRAGNFVETKKMILLR
ncbi:MAG: VCBS repeat-containing protein [bacterium]|nr:VCBS repeat-containing protein [bacterium]